MLAIFAASIVTNPYAFIYAYSVPFGVGKGLMYSSALSAAISHMPERKGTVTGLVVCGFGFGGFLFGIVTNRLCNPDDIKPSPVETKDGLENLFPAEVAERVPSALRQIGFIWAGLIVFGILTVNKKAESARTIDEPLLPDGE